MIFSVESHNTKYGASHESIEEKYANTCTIAFDS